MSCASADVRACDICHGAGARTLDDGNVPCPECGVTWTPGAGVPLDATGWERVARDLWEELGRPGPPACALQLAANCRLRVLDGGRPGGRRYADVIEVDASAPNLQFLVAHELGHWALRRANSPNSEAGASYVGVALLRLTGVAAEELRGTRCRA